MGRSERVMDFIETELQIRAIKDPTIPGPGIWKSGREFLYHPEKADDYTVLHECGHVICGMGCCREHAEFEAHGAAKALARIVGVDVSGSEDLMDVYAGRTNIHGGACGRYEKNRENGRKPWKHEIHFDLDLYQKAYRMAERSHRGHKRFNGDPFIHHPHRVSQLVMEWAGTSRFRTESSDELTHAMVVAVLHDTLEDTHLNPDTIASCFGDGVLSDVLRLTRRPGQSYFDFIMSLRFGKIPRMVKIADLTDNLTDNLKSGSLRDKYELARWILRSVD